MDGLVISSSAFRQAPRSPLVPAWVTRLLDEPVSTPSEAADVFERLRKAARDGAWESLARFSVEEYTRTTLVQTDRVEVVLLAWMVGQGTPIHDHDGAVCAYTVLDGRLRDERFASLTVGAGSPTAMRRGHVGYCAPSDIHRLKAEARSVSLHIYWKPSKDSI